MLLLTFFFFLATPTSMAFFGPRTRRRVVSIRSTPYGKGTEIWPPTNETPIHLADSFPNGIVPEEALQKLRSEKSQNGDTVEWSNNQNQSFRTARLILRRAAQSEESQETLRTTTANQNTQERTWGIRLLVLLVGFTIRYLRPVDVAVLFGLNGYLGCLTYWSQLRRADGVTPCLPALPPTGHVPYNVVNPIGYAISSSLLYANWLRLGVLSNIVLPALLVAKTSAAHTARPLLLAACQALTEVFLTQRLLTPLPIRILVPVLYSAVRLAYAWQWMVASSFGPLAVLNGAYGVLHLFGFLIPVVVPRYMRAHVLGVEVEQATVRPGLEDSVIGFHVSR